MRKFLIGSIRLYQKLIHPLLNMIGTAQTCRYSPTCSNYATESIEKYGSIKGTAGAIKRISRCHPFAQGGFDPVT